MKRETCLAYMFLVPFIVVSTALGWFPVLIAFWFSLQSYSVITGFEAQFVGFGNYISLLENQFFWITALHSLYVMAFATVLELTGGMMVALLLNREFRGRSIFRSIMVLPWTLPAVVTALVWKGIFDPNFGALNGILLELGLIRSSSLPVWLSGSTALGAVILVHVWRITPLAVVLMLANLQVIPQTLYEAAEADGATVFDKFRRITFPLLRPSLAISALFLLIQAFQLFDEMYILTYQDPGTETIMMNAYFTTFKYLDFGLGATMAYVMIFVTAAIGILYFRRMKVSLV